MIFKCILGIAIARHPHHGVIMSRELAALLLFVLYAVLTLGIRAYQQWRETGHSGLVGIGAPIHTAAGMGGLLFVLGVLLGALAPIAALLGVVPALVDPPAWVTFVGGAIALLGIVLTYVAQLAMG